MNKVAEFEKLLRNEYGPATRIPIVGRFFKKSRQKATVNFFNSLTKEEWIDVDLSKINIDIFLRSGIRVDVVDRVAPIFYNYYFDDKNYLANLKKLLNLQSGETEIPLALHKAAECDDLELVRILLSKNKFSDIDAKDDQGNTPFVLAIRNGDIEMLKILVEKGASLDVNGPSINFLNKAIISKQDKVLEYLLENGKNFKKEDIFLMAAYKDGKFIRRIKYFSQIPEEKIKKIHEIACAYFYLGLSYSISGFGLNGNIGNRLVYNEINGLKSDFEKRDKLVESAKIIAEKGEFIDCDGEKNKIIKALVKAHAAYFIVKYDKSDRPCEISYCDANLPIDKKKGVVTFQIDQEKLAKFGNIEKYLEGIKYETSTINLLREGLAKITVCDEKNYPKIISTSIPTKPQKRGNCTLKSFNIVLREILSKKYSMDFTSPDSDGSKVYKKYRKNLKDKNLRIFFYLLDNGVEEILPESEKTLLDAAKIIFLKSIAKKDEEVEKKVGEFLLEKNQKLLEIEDEMGKNILFFAVQSGDVTVVDRVLKMGADINHATKKGGYTPLHEAADIGEVKIVKKLLKNGADVESKTIYGSTPLHSAIYNNKNEIAKILIGKMTELGLDLRDEFHLAARYGNKEIVEEMMKHNVKTARNVKIARAVEAAERAGHAELAKEIAEYEKKLKELPRQKTQVASASELIPNEAREILGA